MNQRSIMLQAVAFFRQHPFRHIMNVWARNDIGMVVSPISPDAHCFCFLGKVHNLLGLPPSDTSLKDWRALGITGINDTPYMTLSKKLDAFEGMALTLPEGE